MISMKVAYHVDDELDSIEDFGILDIVAAGSSIIASSIRLEISKALSSGRSIVFPNRIVINKINVLSAVCIDRLEIDQGHAFFIKNISKASIPIGTVCTIGDISCSLLSIHGFDISNTHITAHSDLIRIDNPTGIFPSINESRIGLLSFYFTDTFHFTGKSDRSLNITASLLGKILIHNLCIGSDNHSESRFELLSLKQGTVLEILNMQYVDFHSNHSSVEINIDKLSKLLNIEAEDDTRVRVQS